MTETTQPNARQPKRRLMNPNQPPENERSAESAKRAAPKPGRVIRATYIPSTQPRTLAEISARTLATIRGNAVPGQPTLTAVDLDAVARANPGLRVQGQPYASIAAATLAQIKRSSKGTKHYAKSSLRRAPQPRKSPRKTQPASRPRACATWSVRRP